MFKLAVFDLDGTLIDSMDAIVKSMNVTFAEIGLGPYTWEDDIVRFFGKPFEDWAETLLREAGKYSKENMDRMTAKMWENYAKIGVKEARMNPGAIEVLEALKKKGVRLAVATNMRSHHMKIFFSHFGLEKYFDRAYAGSDVKRGKPYPDLLERIMEDTDIEKSSTLMVGDSRTDIEFARNAGIKIALLESPWNLGLKADYRIKTLKELLEIV